MDSSDVEDMTRFCGWALIQGQGVGGSDTGSRGGGLRGGIMEGAGWHTGERVCTEWCRNGGEEWGGMVSLRGRLTGHRGVSVKSLEVPPAWTLTLVSPILLKFSV